MLSDLESLYARAIEALSAKLYLALLLVVAAGIIATPKFLFGLDVERETDSEFGSGVWPVGSIFIGLCGPGLGVCSFHRFSYLS